MIVCCKSGNKTYSDLISEVSYDTYNVLSLIRLCDDVSNYVYKSEEGLKNPYFSCDFKFFVRTFEDNKLLVEKESGELLFSPPDVLKMYDNISVNDYVLLTARDILKVIFDGADLETICMNCLPTPFGITRTNKGFEIVMQMCYNTNSNLAVPKGYELVPFDECGAKCFNKIRKTIRTTR